MKTIFQWLLVGLVAVILSGCGGAPSKATDDSSNLTVDITGKIQKGPYKAGTVITVQELDSQLHQTGKSYTTTIKNDKGEYDFEGKLTTSIVEIYANGYYFNEYTGSLSKSQLQVDILIDLKAKNVVNVNIMSSLLTPRIKFLVGQNKTFKEAKSQASKELLSAFNISNTDNENFEDYDLSDDDEQSKILLAVTSILLKAAIIKDAKQGSIDAEISSLLAIFKDDFKDGKINSSSLKKLIEKALLLTDVDLVQKNLAKAYGYKVPDFSKYIKGLTRPSKDPILHNGTTYYEVWSPYTGKIWLDRNLGAESVCDGAGKWRDCVGDSYQWGRKHDGHQNLDAQIGQEPKGLADNVDNVGHGVWIRDENSKGDWATVDNDGAIRSSNWSKGDGSSICPKGFRVPLQKEFSSELYDEGSAEIKYNDDAVYTFLHIARQYYFIMGNPAKKEYEDVLTLWTSEPQGNSYAKTNKRNRSRSRSGFYPVRCIKN